MIRDDAVHDELQLTDQQRDEIIDALADVDGRWFRSRNLPAEKQAPELETLSTQLSQTLAGILDQRQMTRLHELQRQALGTRMVLLDDVAQALNVTKDQNQSFLDAFAETDTQSKKIQLQLQKGDKQASEANKEIEQLKNEERRHLIGQLTADQRTKLGSLTGRRFDFGRVKRTYPLAPELTSEGATWIQGGPLTLKELRGKVVAVHFYAFQCINCKRNLPHYTAWHADYADKDLVVIGIQTPETPSEQKLDRVAEAANRDGIRYPLMMDAQSSNWRAWNNTMWPTVYLIDKRGFIRRWWQGEMNWNGTPGEQQMRDTIEQLLAEES